jgi:hypothetical protein
MYRHLQKLTFLLVCRVNVTQLTSRRSVAAFIRVLAATNLVLISDQVADGYDRALLNGLMGIVHNANTAAPTLG